MILVRFAYVAFVAILSLAATIGSAAWSYSTGIRSGFKGDAEETLFLGLILAALELAGIVLLARDARKKRGELEKFAELVRYGGTISDKRLSRFGYVGRQLGAILGEMNEASDRKSSRIASLTGLLRTTLDLVDKPVAITGLDGRIIAISGALGSDAAFEGASAGNSRIDEFLPDIDFRSILEEADRTHATVERGDRVRFIPTYSTNGEISHFLAEFGKKGTVEKMMEAFRAAKPAPDVKSGAKKEGLFERLRGRLPWNRRPSP